MILLKDDCEKKFDTSIHITFSVIIFNNLDSALAYFVSALVALINAFDKFPRFNDILFPNDFLILHNVIVDIIHLRIAGRAMGLPKKVDYGGLETQR